MRKRFLLLLSMLLLWTPLAYGQTPEKLPPAPSGLSYFVSANYPPNDVILGNYSWTARMLEMQMKTKEARFTSATGLWEINPDRSAVLGKVAGVEKDAFDVYLLLEVKRGGNLLTWIKIRRLDSGLWLWALPTGNFDKVFYNNAR